MKKILLFGLLFIGLNCFAQGTGVWKGEPGSSFIPDPKLPTTIEAEYNYLTKGLKAQRENDLPNLEGYEFKDEEKVIIQNKYLFTFSNLIEKSTGNLKAVSVLIRSGVSKSTYYLCIPVNNTVYTEKYEQVLGAMTIELSKAYSAALSQRYWKMSREILNKNK